MVMIIAQYNFKRLCTDNIHRAIALWALVALSSGCADSTAYFYERQNAGNASCASLFDIPQIQLLSSKMPILPGQLPTRDMITSNDAPSQAESLSIGMLEAAIRNCKAQREAAGIPTSATEDILQARISGLRYALYQGEIPFAVYNYGLAQALKKHTAFIAQSEQVYAQGSDIGDKKMMQKMGRFTDQMNARAAARSSWTCTSDMNGYSATCR